MRRNATLAFPVCAAMLVAGWSGVAMAQLNCETIRAEPDRTDCYIGVSSINREKSAIGMRSSGAGLTRASISSAKILRNVCARVP